MDIVLGVVGAIMPWNVPVMLMTMKIGPALITGNTIVAKPAPTTPLTALLFAEMVKDLLPKGVINIIIDANDLGALMTQAFATCFPGGNPALRHPAAQHATIRVYPTAPACPPEYRDKGLQTRVIVRLQVDEEGLPISAQMVTGPPELEAAALDYALTMVFEPAMAGGVAQKAQYTVPVPFVL